MAGAFWGYYLTYLSPVIFLSILVGAKFVLMTILGGRGTVAGPVVGAIALHRRQRVLRRQARRDRAQHRRHRPAPDRWCWCSSRTAFIGSLKTERPPAAHARLGLTSASPRNGASASTERSRRLDVRRVADMPAARRRRASGRRAARSWPSAGGVAPSCSPMTIKRRVRDACRDRRRGRARRATAHGRAKTAGSILMNTALRSATMSGWAAMKVLREHALHGGVGDRRHAVALHLVREAAEGRLPGSGKATALPTSTRRPNSLAVTDRHFRGRRSCRGRCRGCRCPRADRDRRIGRRSRRHSRQAESAVQARRRSPAD